jgi:DNA repair protein RecO (recombination protein O)
MKPKTYSSEAVVLLRKNYKEADRIISVFSKKFGKITLLAKGVRKLKSKKRGHIEVFSNIKFIASKTKTFDIVTETETINDFSQIRSNLNKVTLAYFFCEVVEKITREDEALPKIYDLLVKYLTMLEIETDLKSLRFKFVEEILKDLGYLDSNTFNNLDALLEEVLERKVNSVRVGKKVLE